MENKEKKQESRTAPAPETAMPEMNTAPASSPAPEATMQGMNAAPASAPAPETAMPEMNAAPAPAPAPAPAAQPAAAGKGSFWKENVTRKFLAIALAVSVALNVVLTVGVVKLIRPGKGFDRGSFSRPGNEQQFDNGRGGRGHMMPPSGSSKPGTQQNPQPGTQQDPQPDSQQNQQSDDQQNSDQKSDDQKNA